MTVARESAEVLLAVRHLVEAIAAARPDGPEVLASFRSGHLRVVIDERSGTIGIGVAPAIPGDPVDWLETVCAVPADEATFGRLESQQAAPVWH